MHAVRWGGGGGGGGGNQVFVMHELCSPHLVVCGDVLECKW